MSGETFQSNSNRWLSKNGNTKTKTDLIDSVIIVDMLLYHEPAVSTVFDDLAIYQLRELCKVCQRNVDKCTKRKIQLIRNLDLVWSGYKSVMKSIFGKTSMTILKKYSVPSNVSTRQKDVNLLKYYEKKRNEGKHFFTALNAVAAKLLRIVYWVLNNNKEYQTQPA